MKFFRLYKILTVFKAYRLKALLPPNHSPKWLICLLFCFFWVKRKGKNQALGERLLLALQELGPVWIKFGQMISTRRDLLPADIANALIQLQDNVSPFDGKIAKQLIESALGHPIDYYFSDFNLNPLASASIAQVHTAVLKSSQAHVVIKILRPDILPMIKADIALMYWAAKKLSKKIKSAEKLHIIDIVHDYELTLLKELDLQREAYNTMRLRANFVNSELLYIPYVYQDLCRKNLLVEERVDGIPIANIALLKQNNVDMKLLAERGVQVFFTQVFRDNFFHADMHPGNIFVDISEPDNPRYIGIDCAIVGELSKEDQHYLAENFLAFFNRDYRKIAQTYILSGWVPKTTDTTELEIAMRNVCEPAFAKPLFQISFAQILLNLFQVARQFNMEIQPQLTLLEKTLFYIEGIGRQLYPDLDLWTTAKPFLEKWYQDKYSAKKIITQFCSSLPEWQMIIADFPDKIKKYDRDKKEMLAEIVKLNNQFQQNKKRQKYLTILTGFSFVLSLTIITLLVK